MTALDLKRDPFVVLDDEWDQDFFDLFAFACRATACAPISSWDREPKNFSPLDLLEKRYNRRKPTNYWHSPIRDFVQYDGELIPVYGHAEVVPDKGRWLALLTAPQEPVSRWGSSPDIKDGRFYFEEFREAVRWVRGYWKAVKARGAQ